MEEKDIKSITSISDFFSPEDPNLTPEQKWETIFEAWLNKIDQKRLMPDLFELKLWFEGLEEFFSSSYLENLVFKYQRAESRDYQIYISTFTLVAGKIVSLLKTLDFEKDKFLQNFEEYIVDRFLENYSAKSFPYIKDVYSPESWFYGLRIFMQNLKNIAADLVKTDEIPQKTFSSLKRLYRKELMNNSIAISLLRGSFIPKMDKIYQQDICEIITSIADKKLKKDIGIFFILAFRILKINDFVTVNLDKSRNINIALPLILALKKNFDHIISFHDTVLNQSLKDVLKKERELTRIDETAAAYKHDYKKIYEGEFPYYFEADDEKVNKRKLLKNVAVLSDLATKQIIISVAQLFKPEINGEQIFGEFVSREQMSAQVKKKLEKLHARIDDYLANKGKTSSADIFYEINLFLEVEFNYLLFKDWSGFLKLYNSLAKSDFTPEFRTNLKSFNTFIAKIINEISKRKSS